MKHQYTWPEPIDGMIACRICGTLYRREGFKPEVVASDDRAQSTVRYTCPTCGGEWWSETFAEYAFRSQKHKRRVWLAIAASVGAAIVIIASYIVWGQLELRQGETQSVQMPPGDVLHFAWQPTFGLCLWVKHFVVHKGLTTRRRFHLAWTGAPVDLGQNPAVTHVGTALTPDGGMVWHCFEVIGG